MTQESTPPSGPSDGPRGPIIYEVFRGVQRGGHVLEIFQFPIYTDAHITGEIALPAFDFINPVAVQQRTGFFRPAIVVRCTLPVLERRLLSMNETDTRLNHGGSLSTVAALLPLCLGMRAKGSPMNRIFKGDPLGRPVAWHQQPWPESRIVGHVLRLPSAAGTHLLDEDSLSRIAEINKIHADQAAALIKAARSYQHALSIGKSESEQASIALVEQLKPSVTLS